MDVWMLVSLAALVLIGSENTVLATSADSAANATTNSVQVITHIVGGHLSTQDGREFMAALMQEESGTGFLCGGSLIAPYFVLTAAHCISNVASVRIGNVSRSHGELFLIDEIIVHPDYDASTSHANDIALLRLASPVYDISPIQLNLGNSSSELEIAGIDVVIAGWGVLEEGVAGTYAERDNLREADIEIISDDYCGSSTSYGVLFEATYMICAGNTSGTEDSCQGDSGGPMFYEGYVESIQIGITSFGAGCAEAGYPGVYVRISAYEDFINEYVDDLGATLQLKVTSAPTGSAALTSGLPGWVIIIISIAVGCTLIALIVLGLLILKHRFKSQNQLIAEESLSKAIPGLPLSHNGSRLEKTKRRSSQILPQDEDD